MDQLRIGERIKKRREEIGLSLQHVADKLDVNRSSVMRWENGETNRIKLPIVEKLAQILQTSPDYLMGYAGTDDRENIIYYELADGRYRHGHYFYLLVSGDSMAPHLLDDDQILVKEQNTLTNGQLGVFLLDGQTFILREYYHGETVELHAFNPYYPVLRLEEKDADRIQIIGRVMESRRQW